MSGSNAFFAWCTVSLLDLFMLHPSLLLVCSLAVSSSTIAYHERFGEEKYSSPASGQIGLNLANVYSGGVGSGGSSNGIDPSASLFFRVGRACPARVHAIEPRHVLINTFFLSLSDDVDRASLPQTYATNKMIDVYSASLAMCCANLTTPVSWTKPYFRSRVNSLDGQRRCFPRYSSRRI